MKILIVDDHALFREGLCFVLESVGENVQILEAADYASAFQLMADNADLNLVLLDLSLPGKGGFDILDEAAKRYPLIPIAVLSASNSRQDINRVLGSAALGFIPKDTTGEVMRCAVRLMLAGGLYFPSEIVGEQVGDNPGVASVPVLTQRQTQVLNMISTGLSNKVIAFDLNIAESTVKMHVTSIFRSLGVSNRTQAMIQAHKTGLVRRGN